MQSSPIKNVEAGDHNREIERDFTIYVIGNNKLQNTLIAYYLQNEIGIDCLTRENMCDAGAKPHLVLMDYRGNDAISIRRGLVMDNVLFFNVDNSFVIESGCSAGGMKDFFHCSDSLEHIRDRLQDIIESREKPLNPIRPQSNLQYLMEVNRKILSRRETEILQLVITGISNKGIAEKLYISVHTVKTHLYNIYKSLNVRNRVEAVAWAQKNAYSSPATKRRIRIFPDIVV